MVYFIIGMSEENTYFALRRFPISIHSFILIVYKTTQRKQYNTKSKNASYYLKATIARNENGRIYLRDR